MKSRIWFSSIVVILILIIYFASCRRAGEWLVYENEPVSADAIVILMGSVYDRVLHASDLYHKGFSRKLIMVETRKYNDAEVLQSHEFSGLSNTGQTRNIAIPLGVNPDSITILPGGATSTRMEAMIIREYLAANPEIDTIMLVSSAEHTRRASIIFKSAFRKAKMPVNVVSSPSSYSDFDSEKWWRSKEQIKDVMTEYFKMAFFYVFDRWRL